MSLSSDKFIFRSFMRSTMAFVAALLLLAGCATDGVEDAQQSKMPSCPTSANDSNWTDVDNFSEDDIAWFNAPGNFAQYASTCQTAAITALVIGNQYGQGDKVDTDPAKAIEWWKKSAALGDIEAENQLGNLYSVKYGNGLLPAPMRDDQQAFQWWGRAATQGNVQAANMIASLYWQDAGTPKDYCGAVSMLLKFANTGDHIAAFQLGQCYKNGWGVPRDDARARYWFLQAQGDGSCLGCIDARKELIGLGGSSTGLPSVSAMKLDAHDRKVLDRERQAAAKGDVAAQLWLGKVYLTGNLNGKVIQADPAKSFAWYRKAAARGNPSAEDNVGSAYQNGSGVKRDEAKALAWYRKAADAGDAQGETDLANMYYYGQGVPKDDSRAFAWYRRAADQNQADAENAVGFMYERGQGVQVDSAQALAWYRRSVAQGSAAAQRNLGRLQGELAQAKAPQSQAVPAQAASSDQADTSQSSDSESAAEWQQDHQAKIDELTQEIANHEQQAQQDDANADQAEAIAQQTANAAESGPMSDLLALGGLVEGSASVGVAVSQRQDAADERRKAQEEREQLAELGAEQPPATQSDSEQLALTQMQTQMIQSGNTIEGEMNRQRANILALGNASTARDAQQREATVQQQREARMQVASAGIVGATPAPVGAVPQGPPSGPVTVIFRGLTSPVAGQAVVTESLDRQACPPDCTFTFHGGSYSVNFFAQANSQSIFRGFEGGCTSGGSTAPETPGNSGGCALGSHPGQANTITVLVDPVSPADQRDASSEPTSSAFPNGTMSSGSGAAQTATGNGSPSAGQYVQPMPSSCVRMFDDPSMNGWIALQNTCSQAITVAFVGKNGNGTVWGSMDLTPGKSGNTGRSPSEIDAVGGIYWYPCPYGFIPATMAGQALVGIPVTEYTCKYRGY